MNFEEIQQMWGRQDNSGRIVIDSDVLLKEVRRNQRQFASTIFWRDFREVGVAILMVFYFGRHGLRQQDWTLGLIALACFGVGMFILVDRIRQKRRSPQIGESLRGCIRASLDQIRHQVWLLRNVFWWYQLPLLIPLTISLLHGAPTTTGVLLSALVIGLVNWLIYLLNQSAVREGLEPRQRELETLLSNLDGPDLE